MLKVSETKHNGRGVFAVEAIPRGTLVVKCDGQVFSTKDLPADCFAMQIGYDLWLCSNGQRLDDCINHSCEPNLGFLQHDPALYALRDIAPDEEVCWDYSTSIAEPGWSLACRCETPGCRGIVLPFPEMSREQQAKLLPVALQYLRESLPV